jgi:hypothetical protein
VSGNYVQYGPWEDGGSPGISAEFLAPLEDFLLSINSAAYDSHVSSDGSGKLSIVTLNAVPSTVTLNGGTAGTAVLVQDMVGSIKRVIVTLNGFRTAGSAQTIAIPVPFTKQCFVRSGNLGSATGFNGFQLVGSSVAQSVGLITALSASGGTNTSMTTIFGHSLGECFHAVDTISFVASSGSNASGSFELVGQ